MPVDRDSGALRPPMGRRRWPYETSLMLAAAALVLCVAAVAGLNLWFLRRLHQQTLHLSAAESVLDLGRTVARHLAAQPVVRSEPDAPQQTWSDFGHLVRGLRDFEPALHYVSVTEQGVILYHEQIVPDEPPLPDGNAGAADVRVGRTLLGLGRTVLPVITFTVPVRTQTGATRSVQVALRKDAVDQEEAAAAGALRAMFRVSLATMTASFGVSLLLVAWVFRREMRWQRRLRRDEHLAFAGALTDGILHDVRNPLSSLRLDVQMLRKEVEHGAGARPERLAELAERARRTLDRVDLVMREFLHVSKPEGTRPEPVELNECVRDCLDLLGPRFEQLGIHLKADLAEQPLPALAFPVGLKRAVINVLTNAKQASPQGGTVRVRTAADGGEAVIEVEDEGPGIPRGERKRIFDMFVSTRPGGTGLGLAMARTAVENSGGTIGVGSASGGGARFTIRLRLAPAGRVWSGAGGGESQSGEARG